MIITRRVSRAASANVPAGRWAGYAEDPCQAPFLELNVCTPVQLNPAACKFAGCTCMSARNLCSCRNTPGCSSSKLNILFLEHRGFLTCASRLQHTCIVSVSGQALERPIARIALSVIFGRRQCIAQYGCRLGAGLQMQPVLQPRCAAVLLTEVQPLGGQAAIKCLREAGTMLHVNYARLEPVDAVRSLASTLCGVCRRLTSKEVRRIQLFEIKINTADFANSRI